MAKKESTKSHELAERITASVMKTIDDAGVIERSRSYLPISTDVKIKPGEAAQITARCQLPFRGDRLAVGSLCAPYFDIESLRVGNRHMDAQAGSVPADAFATRMDILPMLDVKLQKDGFVEVRITKKAEESFGQPLAFPRCPVGNDITIVVTNVGDKPMRWRAVILGDIEYGNLG